MTRIGVSDLVIAGLLLVSGLVAMMLEPAHAQAYLGFLGVPAATLALTGSLLLTRNRIAWGAAFCVHGLLLLGTVCLLLLLLFALLSILLAGVAVVGAPPAVLVAANSVLSMVRVVREGPALGR